MFLEICMQIYSVVFALSRQINKQKVCKNNQSPCEGNKIFVKYQAQGGGFNPNPPLAYALGLKLCLESTRLPSTTACRIHWGLVIFPEWEQKRWQLESTRSISQRIACRRGISSHPFTLHKSKILSVERLTNNFILCNLHVSFYGSNVSTSTQNVLQTVCCVTFLRRWSLFLKLYS